MILEHELCKFKKGYNSQWFKKTLKGRKENYTHERKFIKEVKKVIEKGLDELQDVIPLLYMNAVSSRKVKKSVAKLLGKRGLSLSECNTDNREDSRRIQFLEEEGFIRVKDSLLNP